MDRYIYNIKLHCLIKLDRLTEAITLGRLLDWYYSEYNRIYLQIENDVLMAISYYRQRSPKWRERLSKALKTAEKYNYVQQFAMKGVALLPLLNELGEDVVSSSFLKTVRDGCRVMALKYPKFMKCETMSIPRLTPREQEILGMLCSGETTKDICEKVGISYSGLKKHNTNIYQKLGVKTRAEAEHKAFAMGLVKKHL